MYINIQVLLMNMICKSPTLHKELRARNKSEELCINQTVIWEVATPLRVFERWLRNFGSPVDCCTLHNEGSDESAMTRRERKKLQRRKTETKIEVSVKRRVNWMNASVSGTRRQELTNQSSLSERRETSANTRWIRVWRGSLKCLFTKREKS